jgi:membrane-associated phospholipid phosphatase
MRSRRECGKLAGHVLATLTPRRMRRALPWIALALLVATLLAIALVDEPLARYLDEHGNAWRPTWSAGLHVVEVATGLDVWKWLAGATLLALGCVAFAIPRFRAAAALWWFAGLAHLLSRILGNELKTLFGRLRPSQWVGAEGPTFFVDGGIALPSGHVAHFLGLVLPLAVVKPRLGVPLLVIPILVGWARVATNAHFLGDVLAGAAWTTFVTWLCAIALRVGAAGPTR